MNIYVTLNSLLLYLHLLMFCVFEPFLIQGCFWWPGHEAKFQTHKTSKIWWWTSRTRKPDHSSNTQPHDYSSCSSSCLARSCQKSKLILLWISKCGRTWSNTHQQLQGSSQSTTEAQEEETKEGRNLQRPRKMESNWWSCADQWCSANERPRFSF